ncbi:hypothetical protein OESDEN_07953 [Oesophagostomum dentatum]|uniref:Uncharacterized protein n=1 Tax=Oesophagostomum dentatum TaxID=61180 RepID=A0A0B1T7T1_OESDE|nr:hypothetical protein OESDEN_07953 [Oesophagostomum dentatum]
MKHGNYVNLKSMNCRKKATSFKQMLMRALLKKNFKCAPVVMALVQEIKVVKKASGLTTLIPIRDDPAHFRLEGLKIKDMGADSGDIAEEEQIDDEDQKAHTESVRTWGQVEKKDEEDHQDDDHFANLKQKTAYVIPAQRQHMRGGGQKVDISNNEMFPSLADASKIEKDKKEDVRSGGWLKTSNVGGGNQLSENRPISTANRWNMSAGPPPSAARERDSAIKAVAAHSAQNPAPTPIAREKEPEAPKPAKYVPPSLRNRN